MKNLGSQQRYLSQLVRDLGEAEKLAATPEKNPTSGARLVQTIRKLADNGLPSGDLQAALLDWCQDRQALFGAAVKEWEQRFGLELSSELEALGVQLAGNYPDFTAGVFTIHVDSTKSQADLWYGPKQEKLCSCVASVRDVAATLSAARSKLGSSLSAHEFLTTLRNAYEGLSVRLQTEQVPIVKLLVELAITLQSTAFLTDPRKENYSGYSRADFSYDLLRYGRNSDIKLSVASRAETRSRKDFLWIPDDSSGVSGVAYSQVSLKGA